MCGRASITKTEKEIEARFGIPFLDGLPLSSSLPSTNICPSQLIPVITNADPQHIALYSWGLVPPWAKERRVGYKMFNARKETLLDRPAFKKAAVCRRCLVVMEGFYEWKKEGKTKTPYHISLQDDRLFAVAGLWETWTSPITGELLHTCTVITQEPNDFMAELHDRMPAILTTEQEKYWIDNDISAEQAIQMLEPIPNDMLQAHPYDPVKGPLDGDGKQLTLF